MKPRSFFALGTLVLLAVILAENFVGRQLNGFFLRFPGIDKGLHVIEYFGAFICLHWLVGRMKSLHSVQVLATFGLGIGLALTDEFVQSFAPGRSVELFDVVADIAGLTLAWVAVRRPSPRIGLAVATAALVATAYVAHGTYSRLIDYSHALQYERRHEFSNAREHYLRAIAAGVDTASVYNGLAWVSTESGDTDPAEAVAYAGKALAMQPDNPDVLDTLGWALHHTGRHEEALAFLLRARQLKPQMYCINYHLGSVYIALDQREEARTHLQQQVRLHNTRESGLAERLLATLDEGGASSQTQAHTGGLAR